MNNNMVVKKVIDYIETHIDEDLSLDKIAGALNYSKFYIARAFNQETKCTIYKYIQGRRLTLAAQSLWKQACRLLKLPMRHIMIHSRHLHMLLSSSISAHLKFIGKMACSIPNNQVYIRCVYRMVAH